MMSVISDHVINKKKAATYILPASLVYSKSDHRVFSALFVEYSLFFLLCHNLRLHMPKNCGIGKTVLSVLYAQYKMPYLLIN